MISHTLIHEKPEAVSADIQVRFVFRDDASLSVQDRELDEHVNGLLSGMVADGSFRGKEGEMELLYTGGQIPSRRIMLAGLGKRSAFTGETLRKAAALAVRKASGSGAVSLAIPIPVQESVETARAVKCMVEGVMLGSYHFDKYKQYEEENDRPETISKVLVVQTEPGETKELEQVVKESVILSQAVNHARDLINEPPNVMDPAAVADRAEQVARENGLQCRVLEKEALDKMGMGCFLGVTAGSSKPPKLVVLHYKGDESCSEEIGLVGKGLTFDSGGLSLKPAEGMDAMKGDMAGAATVLFAMEAIAKLKPAVNVTAVLGLCENMPSGTAYRPGDILKGMTGKTVEVLNTDAEGRLVLADCLAYIQTLGVTRIIDVATLTGACVIALGRHATGLISNDDEWSRWIVESGEAVDEACWPLPAFDAYGKQMKSEVADIKNTGGRDAGAITAGMFLKAFIKEVPWVHLDIAGTSYTQHPEPYQRKGGTGVMVRTLVESVRTWKSGG